jgi:hypothetical protein
MARTVESADFDGLVGAAEKSVQERRGKGRGGRGRVEVVLNRGAPV